MIQDSFDIAKPLIKKESKNRKEAIEFESDNIQTSISISLIEQDLSMV